MKFRVSNKVSCFGVGSSVYYPGDIVEGPKEWAVTNSHILEPIPEPKSIDTRPSQLVAIPTEEAKATPSTASHTISVAVEEPVNVEGIVKLAEEEHEKDATEERHATADRRPKKR
jgi:hypothetical protein